MGRLLLVEGYGCGLQSHAPPPGPVDAGHECTDGDGDGYGEGPGCLGADCNDYVAAAHTPEECEAVCSAAVQGCLCGDSAEREPCYSGPPDQAGVGACRTGIATCAGGRWSRCVNEVLAVDEVCDGRDEDCDGVPDDGLLSECGTCAPCQSVCYGPDGCSDWDEGPHGFDRTPEGWLAPTRDGSGPHVLWVLDQGASRALRVDSASRSVEAAFYTGPLHDQGGGEQPQFLATNGDGDVIVSNVGNGVGSLTRIAGSPAKCVDADGNRRISTSDRWNDLLPFDTAERWDDECVLWHTRGEDLWEQPSTRGVALRAERRLDGSLEEIAWVAQAGFAIEVDAATGEATGTKVGTADIQADVLAADADGFIWAAGRFFGIGRFDAEIVGGGAFETLDRNELFGEHRSLVVDESDTVWVDGLSMHRWDRGEDRFVEVEGWRGRSPCGMALDGDGSVWAMTPSEPTAVGRFGVDTAELEDTVSVSPLVFSHPAQLVVDLDRQLWLIPRFESGIDVLSLDGETTEGALNDCSGRNCVDTPTTQRGDAVGLAFRRLFGAQSVWSTVVSAGCEGGADWNRLTVDTEIPTGARLVVSVRAAASVDRLGRERWVELRPEDGLFDLDAPVASCTAVLETKIEMGANERGEAPVLRRVDARWSCQPCDVE